MLKTYHENSDLLLNQLKKGVFLTVKDKEGRLNTMTIAWGHIGVIWYKPVFIAFVTASRYTYDLLRRADDFTVNVPYENTMKQELEMAGTLSGRDVDKFKKTGLTVKPSKHVHSPVIDGCQMQLECKIIYTQTHEPGLLPEDVKKKYYQSHDTHIMFYGEIVASYLKEDK